MYKTKTYTIEAEELIWKAAEQTANNIIQKTLESDPYTREHYALIADQARIAYQFALDHMLSYTNTEIQARKAAYMDAEQRSNHWAATAHDDMRKAADGGHLVTQSLEQIAATAAKTAEAIAAVSGATANLAALSAKVKAVWDSGGSFNLPALTAADISQKYGNDTAAKARLKYIEDYYAMYPGAAPGGSGATGLLPGDEAGWRRLLAMQQEYYQLKAHFPGYADGVMNAPGGWAMVGERGPELVNLPRGANVFPTGSAPGGTTIVNNVYVTQPLGTPAAIAKAVDDALMARLKSSGQRMPLGN